jgi:quercetin dioxygenase-like cupin family protein
LLLAATPGLIKKDELHQSLATAVCRNEFHGENHDAPISVFIVNAKPGQGPPLHTHPYVEVAFTIEGRATITVGDETREVRAGSIVVIAPNTPHRFVNSGDTVLHQVDIHASPRFIQTNLG